MKDDLKLVEEYLNGSESAFEELISRHRKMVYGLAWRMLGRNEDAEDATQQVFITVFRKLETFQAKSSFKTWLYSVTLNECRTRLKKRKILVEPDENLLQTDESIAESEIISEESKGLLKREINKLPFRQKAVITLRINEEKPFREIARIIGCSENSAKVNFQHGINRLKKVFDNEKNK